MAGRPGTVVERDLFVDDEALRRKYTSPSFSSRRSSEGSIVSTPGEGGPASAVDKRRDDFSFALGV